MMDGGGVVVGQGLIKFKIYQEGQGLHQTHSGIEN